MATDKNIESKLRTLTVEIRHLRTRVNSLSRYVKDPDMILTTNDIKSIHEAEEDLRKGRTKRLI